MAAATGSSQTDAYKELPLFRLLNEIYVLTESDEESSDESKPSKRKEIQPESVGADQELMDTIDLSNLNISLDESLSEDEDSSPVFEEPGPFEVFYAKGFEPKLNRDSEAYEIIQELINTGRKKKPLCTFKSETGTYPVYAVDLKKLLAPHNTGVKGSGGNEEAYLNDALVDFFLKYIVENVKYPRNIKLYDSTFYQRFKSKLFQKKPEKLKSVENVFLKEFLMIPICQQRHWILYVCCFLPYLHYKYFFNLTGVGRQFASIDYAISLKYPYYHRKNLQSSIFGSRNKRACLLVFDSLGPRTYINHEKIFDDIRMYLSFEWNHTYGKSMSFNRQNLPAFVVPVPNQQNDYDCGIFVMYNTAYFIKDLYVHRSQEMPPNMHHRFSTESSNLRYEVVKLFETIIKKQRSKQVDDDDDDDDDDDFMEEDDCITVLEENGITCISMD